MKRFVLVGAGLLSGWLLLTWAVSNVAECQSVPVILINDTGRGPARVTMRINDAVVWEGKVLSFRGRPLTVPVIRPGLLVLEARFEDGTVLNSDFGPYVSILNFATVLFIVRRSEIDFVDYRGSKFFDVGGDGAALFILEMVDATFRHLSCPVRVGLNAI